MVETASPPSVEVWIVNLTDEQIEVHREPSDALYRTRHLVTPGDALSVRRLSSLDPIPIREILGDPDEGSAPN